MVESNILHQDLYGNVTEAAHRIELLEAENDRLMAEVERLRSRVAELDADVAARDFEIETLLRENERLAEMMAKGVFIESATMNPEHYDMRTRGVGAMLLAEKLVMFFKASGGENFITNTIEMEFADPKEKERYALTIQKLDGATDSPAEKLQRLEEENAGLQAALESIRYYVWDVNRMASMEVESYSRDARIGITELILTKIDQEKARAALGGEPSDLVVVPRKLLDPFVRIAERLEACQSSRKLPDSAPLSAPMDDIPVEGTYVSLGDVRELARLAKGNPSETPDSSGRR